MDKCRNLVAGILATLAAAWLAIAAAPRAEANPVEVTAQAVISYDTSGEADYHLACDNAAFPSCSASGTKTGLTAASVLLSLSGTTGSVGVNPADANSSAFASVSATEGHVGLSFNAYSDGIGIANAYGSAAWTDVLSIGSPDLPIGTPVTLVAKVGITAEVVGLGFGGYSVGACFSGSTESGGTEFSFCNSGIDTPVTQVFDAYVGVPIALDGTANGSVGVDNWRTPNWQTSSSDYSLIATNSAHFSINPEDPTQGLVLTLESGCSITSGYGCDTPVTAVPEPQDAPLFGGGLALLLVAAMLRRRQRR